VPELHEVLAAYQGSGYVLAPAGFGKTYLIAAAVCHGTGRQLVLTHTYAGVNALRRKMRELKVSDRAFHIDTIASWALRLSLSYPGASGWTVQRPEDAQWTELYQACSRLLDCAFMGRVIQASYSGLYVDEYQDCSTAQHDIILRLARNLPCRILGDPLQGIFDFDGQTPVDWNRDVAGAFGPLGTLDTPHRWTRAGAPAIGAWLRTVREQLEQGQAIDLTQALPAGVTFQHVNDDGALIQTQGNICRYFNCDRQDSVIAIHKGSQEYKAKCHALARNLAGRFSSIEEIEGKALFSFVDKIGRARSDSQRLKTAIAFAGQCLTAVNANLSAATKRGEVAIIRANTRNSAVAQSANAYLAASSSANMSAFFSAVKALNGVELVRADLFNRALGVLRKQMMHPQLTLPEAAEKYHGEFRYKGRPVGHRKLIGTTLLVKGLEFDHAIVLDASSLRKKELYVALTRGAKSLTIISTSAILNPPN
jgi:AAA domain